MSKDHSNYGERQRSCVRAIHGASDHDSQVALQNVEQQDDNARFPSRGAVDICGADIAAAHTADVFSSRKADKAITKGKSSQQICQEGCQSDGQRCGHCLMLGGGKNRFEAKVFELTVKACV